MPSKGKWIINLLITNATRKTHLGSTEYTFEKNHTQLKTLWPHVENHRRFWQRVHRRYIFWYFVSGIVTYLCQAWWPLVRDLRPFAAAQGDPRPPKTCTAWGSMYPRALRIHECCLRLSPSDWRVANGRYTTAILRVLRHPSARKDLSIMLVS